MATLDWIAAQARLLGNLELPERPIVLTDTSDYMSIERGQVIELDGEFYVVRCNEREGRFGVDDQPKFWVKRAVDLRTGRVHILKLAFSEEFKIRVGPAEIRCSRSGEKEACVLELVRGNRHFMQGRTARDARGNLVRVIEFIYGADLLSHINAMPERHEVYCRTALPGILAKVCGSLAALDPLHELGLCHGDIRNDHVLVERDTGDYRWIDFDLTQDFSDFDIWSAGNILHYVVAKGFVTFRDALNERPELSGRLSEDDASAFFPHRVMNLGKVYPYLPPKLNQILLRFSLGARTWYDRIRQLTDDLGDCAAAAGWGWGRTERDDPPPVKPD